MKKKRQPERAFTLIELVIAATLLTIAILTTAFSTLNLQDLGELSKEKFVAVADANRVIEAMRDTANTSLAILRNTDWNAWALNNVINTKGANEVPLNQESVAVNFTGTNPVQVVFTLSWRHRQRPYTHQVVTIMADRGYQ